MTRPHAAMPNIAIIDPNTLAVLGLKHILQSVMPMVHIDAFGSFAELAANHPEKYFHYFADTRIVIGNLQFFLDNRHKTIVLTGTATSRNLDKFHYICIDQPEKQLVRSLLALEQSAHARGRNLPHAVTGDDESVAKLSPREIEVLSLIVKGMINKEIADALNISLPTVVTHRKNVMAKLNARSVSALTVYAVMHGYVDISDI